MAPFQHLQISHAQWGGDSDRGIPLPPNGKEMKCKSGKKESIIVFPKPEADDGAEERTERNINEIFEEVSMQFVQLCRQTTREENNHTNWSLTYLLIA